MAYYPSSEGPTPAFETPWREYRRGRAARRRRRWAAITAGIVVILAGTFFFWPRPESRKAPGETAALESFDTPGLGKTVIVAATKRSEAPEGTSPASPPERDAIATLVAPPEPSEPPPLPTEAVPAQPPPAVASSPAETTGSTSPPAEAVVSDESWRPIPVPKPMPTPEASENQAKSASTAAPSRKGAPHVQLASFRSEARAQSALEKLRNEQSDILGSLDAHVRRAELPDGRVVFRVQAGPLADAGEAKRLCAELHRRKLDCRLLP